MVRKKEILKASKIIPLSESAKKRLSKVAKDMEGKELFPDKIALAKKTLSNLKFLSV